MDALKVRFLHHLPVFASMSDFHLIQVSRLEFGDTFLTNGGRAFVKSIGMHKINGVLHHDSYGYCDMQVQIRLKAHTVVARRAHSFIFCKNLRDLPSAKPFVYSGKRYILIEKMNNGHVIALSAHGIRTRLSEDITVYTQSDVIILSD